MKVDAFTQSAATVQDDATITKRANPLDRGELDFSSSKNAFISYGRADSEVFAKQLHDDLVAQGLTVWFDQKDIPLGVNFQTQINAGIEQSHNFLFVIAPHSVNSPYCSKEIELALQLNKRIIPILHVEQISRETWQQRNPYRNTDEDWEAAQAKGEDSSFSNMHPEISKINWVYCRQSDDYSTALTGLIGLMAQHEDYVQRHTENLVKALAWERHQKQSQYLLVGDDRTQAQEWLKTRFTKEQPPCIPTDLHCEFITESTKNANNLMAQIFLAHAEADKEIEAQVRRGLMREGYTVWTSQRDIQTGVDFQTAINHGIEMADNIVYLLSPDSVASEYCQKELDYALSLNKRIVPLRLSEMAPEEIPAQIRSLQYIDFADNFFQPDDQRDESRLLKILNQDQVYYERHKAILTQSLKWERQQQNSSILMRGYNLQQAAAWLKLAKPRAQHGPTELQQRFIQASLDAPQDVSLDVFVSYSRADSDIARKLNEALQAQGKTTWFDQESIASGSDFQAEIYRGIEESDNFLFIISPNSINSPYCAGEVEHAVKLGKRLVTVLYQPVDSVSLHPELAKVQWIDFNQHDGDFYANFSEVVRTLDTDREHVRSHTKWTQRALEWINKSRGPDLLLRGNEFAVAENWLQEAETNKKQPPPTTLQKDYLTASQQAIDAAIQREQRISLLIKSLLGVVSVACVIAVMQYRTANEQRKRAETVQEGQINALSRYSGQLQTNHQQLQGLVEAIRAGRQLQKQLDTVQPETRDRVIKTLQDALREIKEVNQLAGHPGAKGIPGVAVSPYGQTIATAGVDGLIRLWDADGKALKTLEGHKGAILSIAFSPDGTKIASSGRDKTARIWSIEGQQLQVLKGHRKSVYSVAFSPDGQEVGTASVDRTVRTWTVDGQLRQTLRTKGSNYAVAFSPDGKLVAATGRGGLQVWDRNGELIVHVKKEKPNFLTTLAFSPEGDRIVTGGTKKIVEIWDLDGKLLKALEGHEDVIQKVAFSPDGQLVASASFDQTVKLWTETGGILHTIQGHADKIWSIAFLPKVSQLATASYDGTVRIWEYGALPRVQSLVGHPGEVNLVRFSADGQRIASAGDKEARVWNVAGELKFTLEGVQGPVRGIAFSPDGQYIGTTDNVSLARIWDREGKLLRTLNHGRAKLEAIRFSPDGQSVATAGSDGTVKLWSIEGELLQVLKHEKGVMDVAFSPDGQRIVSGGWGNVVRLWSRDGEPLREFAGHTNSIQSVRFSADGQYILSAANDNTARIWTLDGKEQRVVDHGAELKDASISPDGQIIATAGIDKVVKVWSFEQGQLLSSLTGHEGRVSGLSFTPDGKTLATSSLDKVVKLWQVSSGQLLAKKGLEDNKLSGLLSQSCDWAWGYLSHSPALTESDRLLCQKD